MVLRTFAARARLDVGAPVLYCTFVYMRYREASTGERRQVSVTGTEQETGQRSTLPVNGRVGHRSLVDVPSWIVVAARMAADGITIYAAFLLAYWLRYSQHVGGSVPEYAQQPLGFFHGKIVLLVVLTVALFQFRGLYRLPRWTTLLDEASSIASGVTTGMALVILYAFLQQFYPSRLIFIYAWMLAIALLIVKRIVMRMVRERLWARGIGVDRVVIVGAGRAGQRMMQWLMGQPQLGYQVVGFVDDEPPPDNWAIATQRRVERPRHLGSPDHIREIVRREGIDEVIIALPPTAHAQMMSIMDQCRAEDIDFKLVPDLFELAMDRVNIHEVAGMPLIALKPARIAGWNLVVKRSMDVLLSLFVLVVGALPMALIALAIKLDSDGPVLFRQERVGRNGQRFICYKFRTMVRDAESLEGMLKDALQLDARLIKHKDDPRRTRVGKILRRTSLDELPNFVNILLGQMSVVGPRPPVPREVAEYDDWHHSRLLVTPGLTGLWQVSGRSNLTFDEMVRLDLYYAEHWSPWLDIKIILRTFPAILTARGAY
jgi:exopolysaccharide biosynthesis polyprenyl glycosylphosphotransferase